MIYEALRIHASTEVTLERVVPQGGATVDGYYIPAGTIVGVKGWVIHRNKSIFGEEIDAFRPERWIEATELKRSEMKRYIFSVSSFLMHYPPRHQLRNGRGSKKRHWLQSLSTSSATAPGNVSGKTSLWHKSVRSLRNSSEDSILLQTQMPSGGFTEAGLQSRQDWRWMFQKDTRHSNECVIFSMWCALHIT